MIAELPGGAYVFLRKKYVASGSRLEYEEYHFRH